MKIRKQLSYSTSLNQASPFSNRLIGFWCEGIGGSTGYRLPNLVPGYTPGYKNNPGTSGRSALALHPRAPGGISTELGTTAGVYTTLADQRSGATYGTFNHRIIERLKPTVLTILICWTPTVIANNYSVISTGIDFNYYQLNTGRRYLNVRTDSYAGLLFEFTSRNIVVGDFIVDVSTIDAVNDDHHAYYDTNDQKHRLDSTQAIGLFDTAANSLNPLQLGDDGSGGVHATMLWDRVLTEGEVYAVVDDVKKGFPKTLGKASTSFLEGGPPTGATTDTINLGDTQSPRTIIRAAFN